MVQTANTGGTFCPRLFADVDDRMRTLREEVFGPVFSVFPYRDDEGLDASVDLGLGSGGLAW